jgi:uncharacterized membrane protein YkvA (DUF1232 family)
VGGVLVGLLILAAIAAVCWLLLVGGLFVAGRATDARALARFVPDCLVLARRLLTDPRVPSHSKLALYGLIAYLVMPFDLVPDFIPVAGQLDDALLALLVLRHLVRSAGPDLLRQHWPGPPGGLAVLLRLACYSPGGWRTT